MRNAADDDATAHDNRIRQGDRPDRNRRRDVRQEAEDEYLDDEGDRSRRPPPRMRRERERP